MKNMDIELMAKLLQNERKIGIAEGLRMAEKIAWEYDFDNGDLKHLCNFLLAKAKEVEEANGEGLS